MINIQRFLTFVYTFVTGMIVSSIWITKTDSYKTYIPIILILIIFKLVLYDDNIKN